MEKQNKMEKMTEEEYENLKEIAWYIFGIGVGILSSIIVFL